MNNGLHVPKSHLHGLLEQICAAELTKSYDLRNRTVLRALGEASTYGYEVGIRLDPSEPEWPVAFIELPTGQVSWHLKQHERTWDGHDTEEKYRRVQDFLAGAHERVKTRGY
jgi:hypothetical protein